MPSAQRLTSGLGAAALAMLLAACGGGGNEAGPTSGVANSRMRALAAGTAAQGGVMINEVHAANWKGALDEDGDAEDWVELYNPAAVEVDLSGYGLTNNTRSPFRWAFPAGQKIGPRAYLRVWLSKKNRATLGKPLHASFNLDNGADGIYLSASNATAAGILVDSTTPPLVKPDHSWCRLPSGSATATFQICSTPTPEAANSGTGFATMLAKPVLSVPSGLYAGPQSVTITGPAGATIRYTTDGSMPTASSSVYGGPIAVGTSQVLRAAAFSATALSSPAESNTYVIDTTLATRYAGLKVLFATLEPADLTRYQARDKDLNALVHLEMLAAGTRLFKQDADGSVAGNAGSLDSPQVAMNANARDVFGPKDFVAAGALWPAKPTITTVKKLRIRNGGNDWAATRLRDQLSQDLGAAGPNVYGAASAVAMFINGQYYALMDLREREDETIVANNTGADKDYVEFLENPLIPGQEIKNGGGAALGAYQTAHDFIVGNDMSVAANYAQAQRLIDVTSLAWDWAQHITLANYDWPNNNVHVYRSPELGNRWTWRPHDFDFALGRYVGPERNMNSAYTEVGSAMFAALLRSPEFRNLYLNISADLMNLMNPTFMNARLDLMANDMRPYVNDTFSRNNLGGEAGWNTNLATLRNWMRLREPFHDQHLRTQFGLGNRGAIGVAINDRTMGTVKVNTLDVGAQMGTRNGWSGKFYPGVPVTLQAQPKPGHVFVGWAGASTSTARTLTHTVSPTPALQADGFSVRWSGEIAAPATGGYRFQVIADDGVALRINGQTLTQNFGPRVETTFASEPISLTAGQRVSITMQYLDFSGAAKVRLLWLPPGSSEFVPVPAGQLYADANAPYPTGLFGAYFNNLDQSGTPVATAIENIDFDWGTQAPTPSRVEFEAIFAAGPAPAAPALAAVPAQSGRTGDLVNLVLNATDSNGHPLRYSATGLPRGVSLNAGSGIIFGRLTTPGTYNATITVTNGASSATLPITWTVTDRPGTGLLGTSADSGTPPTNTPPSVSLTAPASAQTLTLGASLTLSASASDSDGNVVQVAFFDGATLIGSVTSAPYTLNWTPGTAGTRAVTAQATDNAGATRTSVSVSVTVQPAANTPPSVALTSPTAGQTLTLGSSITLRASASDKDGSIQKVEFLIDGNIRSTSTAAPYEFTWSPGLPGSRVIAARAYDNQGAVTTSAAVTLTVLPAANKLPTVSITAPANGAGVLQGTAVTISANAADPDGSIARVSFYDGTALLGTATQAPYSFTWTPPVGTHVLTAVAVDNAGASTTSAAVTLNVTAPPAGPVITATPSTVARGRSTTVAWSGITRPTSTDWIGLYAPGAGGSPIRWMYVSCSTFPLSTRASGSCSFSIPSLLSTGTYEFRLYAANGSTLLAKSAPVTVTR